MARILDEARYYFNRVDSAVRKLIIINVMIYLFVELVTVLLIITGMENELWDTIVKGLMLPPTFSGLIYKPWTLITYMFMHGGILHILFNMLWLFFIGNILQDFLGNRKIYIIYLLGGIAGGLFSIICYLIFPALQQHMLPMVGASASVVAILAAAATLLPHYEINFLLIGFVKLRWIAIIAILIDILSLPYSNTGGHLAHIGGAIFGFFYIRQLRENTFLDKIDLGKLNVFRRRRKKVKVYTRTTYMASSRSHEPAQEEIDAILDKISVSGYESLTKEEKEILFKASQKND